MMRQTSVVVACGRRIWLRWRLAAVVLFGLAAWAAESPAEGDQPNIVLVMADDQGWGDMAYNGHPHVKTPNFDALSREGIRFDRFHSASPVCSPTRASVLTGRTPNRSGTLTWGYPLRPQEETIAAILRRAGYRTGHFGKWHLGSVQEGSPVNPGEHGFDEWVSAPNFFDLDPILSDRGKAVRFEGDSSEVTVDVALQFIRKQAEAGEPFFAVVWFGSPHLPHEALEADRELYSDRPERERDFLGEITAMDRAFGRLRGALRELGVHENTILWYNSDNGALPRVGSAGNARGFKGDVYEGGLLVPALLEWPGRFSSPAVIDVPCVTMDIFPTLLAAAGVEYKLDRPIDGMNLLPILEGKMSSRPKGIGFWHPRARGMRVPAAQWMEELFTAQSEGEVPKDSTRLYLDAGKIEPVPTNRFPGHAAWLDFPWKLHRMEAAMGKVAWELYNLADDPVESRDLSERETARVAALREQFDPWLESVAKSLGGADYPAR